MCVHRSTLPDGAHKSTPNASRSATQNVRNPVLVLDFKIELYYAQYWGYALAAQKTPVAGVTLR
jgi:hypothetical protein